MFIFTSRADKYIPLNSTIKSARASQNNDFAFVQTCRSLSDLWVSKFSGNGILWVSCLSLFFDSNNVEQCVTDCCRSLPEIYCTHNILKWHRPRRPLRLKLEQCIVSLHSPQPGSVFGSQLFWFCCFFLYPMIRQGINYSAKILLANLTLQSTLLHGHESTNNAINEKCKLGCLLAWITLAPWLEQSTTEKDIHNSNGLKGPYNLLHFPFACILTLINERILYAVAYNSGN